MRILFTHRVGGAYGFISESWINACRDRGHQVQRWDGLESSWNAFRPDVYLGCSGHRQPIPPKRNCKVAIHVNPFGPVEINGINESVDAIRWTVNQKPDAVFGYGYEEDRLLWSYWTTKHGIPWVPMPTAADKTIFKLTNEGPRAYDVVYLGGKWAYKSKTIDAYLLPVLSDPRVKSRVHGWGDWPSHINKGMLNDDLVVGFFNDGKVAPCMSEMHTQSHGIDIPERAFKVALCGALIVHDPVPRMQQIIPSAVVAQNADNYRDLCVHYSRPQHEAERAELAAKQRAEVLASHTYHHRLHGLFSALGLESNMLGE